MRKNLQTTFSTRQYMLSKDFEIYYYSDTHNKKLPSKVQNHSHDYYEFYFFLEGDVSIRIEDSEYPLKTGDMILIPPKVMHRAIIHNTDIPYRRFVFWISEDFCHQLSKESTDYFYLMQLTQMHRRYIFHYDIIGFNALQSKVFQLIEEINSDHYGKTAKISLCVHDLILFLNRTVYEKEHPKSHSEELSLYQNLIQYIETHLDEDLSLDKLAQEFYVSKYHISHIFKDNMGLSIHQFITKKRLAMCRDAILSHHEISQLYLLYGFNDYSSFFRAFKKEFGMSPKEYKELFRTQARESSAIQ